MPLRELQRLALAGEGEETVHRALPDLLDVRGIGPAKFEALKDLVTV